MPQDGYLYRERERRLAHVVEHWELTSHHELSETRRGEFLQRRETLKLAFCPEDRLLEAAIVARRRHPNGNLLLADWWQVAEELRLNEAAALHQQMLDMRESDQRPEGSIERCPACGTGIDFFSGKCGCD